MTPAITPSIARPWILTGLLALLTACGAPATPPATTLSAAPQSVDFRDATAQSVVVTCTATLPLPTVTSTCDGIATVTPGASTGTSSTYTVAPMAVGSAGAVAALP